MDGDSFDDFMDSLLSEDGSNLDAADIDSDHKVILDGKEYIETKHLARPVRKGGAAKSSSIWRLGTELKRVDDGVKFWQCLICKKINKSTLFTSTATTSSFRHLKNEHGIVEENKRLIRLDQKQTGLGSETSGLQESQEQSPIYNDLSIRMGITLLTTTLIDEFRLLFLQWIICCHLALSMVENPFFRLLIRFINRTILDHLPESSTTVRKWIISEYQRQKAIRKEVIGKARSCISISFDTWTSPFSKKHVVSVIAHFVDEHWERRHLQLSMGRLYGDHSGANLAAHITPILSDWGIEDQIGYFITDNEASNGTAIDGVLSAVDPTYKTVDRSKRWIRCLPHTLNLVARAFIYGQDPLVFETSVQEAELKNDSVELRKIWRTHGFIGKLWNIINFMRRSPKRRLEFEKIKVDESGDVEWLAVQDVEDEQQLEVKFLSSPF